ncbi:hypothetical protein HanIR_Chr14g0685211 [Helianthus annuus]|nr:hypothetical protein HanIR_Chr14g0685211 [Helianthus annuus]
MMTPLHMYLGAVEICSANCLSAVVAFCNVENPKLLRARIKVLFEIFIFIL